MLKSILSAEFFSVALASDSVEFETSLRNFEPDIILIGYRCELAVDFANLKALKANSDFKNIPVVFLTSPDCIDVWTHSYDLLVDDVLSYAAQNWYIRSRLNLLLRTKDSHDAIRARQNTFFDMGFAESQYDFSVPETASIVIDATGAKSIFTQPLIAQVKQHLASDFQCIKIYTTPQATNVCDITIVSEADDGENAALTRVSARKSSSRGSQDCVLYLGGEYNASGLVRAIDLGIHDFASAPVSAIELACRIRSLAMNRNKQKQADKAVDTTLKTAMLDPLTALYNRRYALQYLNRITKRHSENSRSVAVMMLDLDNFKTVNDTFGHSAGDHVLCETANRLADNLRSADLVARIGGEEFLVVLADASDDLVQKIAERLRRQINDQPFVVDNTGRQIDITISIGVSQSCCGSQSLENLMQSADKALYVSKNRGRNRVTFSPKAA